MTTIHDEQKRANCEELDKIKAIGSRAVRLAHDLGTRIDAQEQGHLQAAIALVHRKEPIDLDALLAADDGNFGHDVFGIRRFYDPVQGILRDGFSPRYTV